MINTDVKFSILVPVYNVEAYIRECVDSVLQQSYPNFELILVDDGSPDNSGSICDDYAVRDNRIRVFHKPNGGLMHTRRFALEKALGDYIVFLDSDDYLALNTLEVLRKNIDSFGADCIIYGLSWLHPDGIQNFPGPEAYFNRLITDKAEILQIVMCNNLYNSLCRKCVRASCFKNMDFSNCYHIRRGEDRVQTEEILENAESFLFIPDILYCYRVNPSSITHNLNLDGYKADFEVQQRSVEFFNKFDFCTAEDFNRLRNSFLDELVIELKRLSRYCSSTAESCRAMESIRKHGFYENFLSLGYRSCRSIPGINSSRGIRRWLNSLIIFLLSHRLYSLVIFICRHVFKAR